MRLLERCTRSLGVAVRWRRELTQLVGDSDITLVVVGPDGGYTLTIRYILAADGSHSCVRKNVRIEFPENTASVVIHASNVHIPDHLRAVDSVVGVFGFGVGSILYICFRSLVIRAPPI